MPDQRILVIKLGAFGNVVLSLAAFGAIRAHHPCAEISVLTTAPYAGWLGESPWFDKVLIDQRPNWWDLPGVLRLRRQLIAGRFGRVYDLQTSGRSSRYFRLFWPGPKPEWSGIADGCSHPDRDPRRDHIHDMDRQHGQLRQAGIETIPPVNLDWCQSGIGRFNLPRDFALLIPGSSPHRPAKRWPATAYRELARALAADGITPVVLGAASERPLAQAIGAPFDLTGQTGFNDLVCLARAARFAVGNDTGPMHLAAAAGCRSAVLFSSESDPALCAPRGADVTILRRARLADLPLDDVLAATRSHNLKAT